MMKDNNRSKTIKDDRLFTRGPVLDNIEAVIVAIILALVLRCFIVEAFMIPSGSMAGTLYGMHYDVRCPECGYKHAIGHRSDPSRHRVFCPNCGKPVPGQSHRLQGGDRILVNKVLYRFDKPARWDPFVFINPRIKPNEDPPKTTFIKRLIGLPGETLEIIRGDIIIDGQVQRKHRAAQRRLWMHVYDSRWPWKNGRTWLFDDSGVFKENKADGSLTAEANEAEVSFADFAGHRRDRLIRDNYGYNNNRSYGDDNSSGNNVVTDVRLRLNVTAHGYGGEERTLVLVLPEDESELRCVLAVEGAKKTRSRVMLDGKVLGESDVKLPTGRRVSVEFSRVDFLVTVKVDGKEVFRHDFWTKDVYEELARKGRAGELKGHVRSGVRIGISSLTAEFSRVRIDRDMYYGTSFYGEARSHISDRWASMVERPPFDEGTVLEPDYFGPVELTDDQYMAMGDNSPDSSDSRYWGPVPRENLIGKAFLLWWYPTRLRLIQ